MKKVTVGLVGSGFAAQLHGNAYKKVSDVNLKLKSVVDLEIEKAKNVAKKYRFEQAYDNFDVLLQDDEIDVIDICTPPFAHSEMIIKAMEARKHVICEKPLTGYFGKENDSYPIGANVSKSIMYDEVIKEMKEIEKVIKKTGRIFMYAENYVYCPNIQKTAEIIREKKSKILFAKGELNVRGSSSPVAGRWDKTGGGSLIRNGCHPLSGILWLKQQEAMAREVEIKVKKVVADTGFALQTLSEKQKKYFINRPIDVEDIAVVSITFTDGSKALITASDVCLGGTKNYMEVYCNDSSLICNITPTDVLNTYFLDEDGLEDVTISEILPTKIGWNKAFVADEILRGYVGQFQDFVSCVAHERQPLSGFHLAYETTKVIYAAYKSAEESRTIEF